MTPSKTIKNVAGLLGWLAASFSAAALGGVASASAGSFYAALARPLWAPPGWLFAPVWSVLYFMMGVAAWLVWKAGGFRQARTALTLFMVQLVANALWTWIFFYWRNGRLAFLEILLLWGLVLATAIAFRRVRPVAGLLLLPYVVWVTYATALTFSIWRLNPSLLG